ncbi:MAG TPA: choice-of-anchor P family protein [Actinomycetota bacterium]|nr:choice-of-anchor P family protein [Actinomycetota bacterium]
MQINRKFSAYLAALVLATFAVAVGGGSASGETVSSATTSAYGVQLSGPVPIEAQPAVSASIADGHADDAVLVVPADPLATSFTASVSADASKEATQDALLQAVMEAQSPGLPTKWNARGHAITEDLQAVTDQILADVIESESVAACDGNAITFGSAARIVNLVVAGTAVVLPPPAPNQVVIDQLGIRIVFWETNWDPATGGTTDGSDTVFTNGVHITAPGGIDLIVSHSEATAACALGGGPQTGPAQCDDGRDNNDAEDTLADADDPGCHTDGDATNSGSYDPDDDNEADAAECDDGVDNDDAEDSLSDINDPGCHTDGNPANSGSYDRNDDDEGNGLLDDAPPAAPVNRNPAFTG